MPAAERPGGRRPAYWWSPEWPVPLDVEAVGPWDVARPGPRDLARMLGDLRSAGENLRTIPAAEIAGAVGRVGERILEKETGWLSPLVAREAGFSGAMASRVVQGMAEGWTRSALRRLLEAEFENPAVLDGFAAARGRRLHARGRGLTFHVGAGSVPGVTATSMIRALLVKCPSLAKPGAGDITLSVALLELLWEEAPELARGAAVLYWEGGSDRNRELETLACSQAEQVVAYGGPEAMEGLRTSAGPHAPVLLHGPRTGVVIAVEETDASGVADAAALFDQRGCVSPHVVLFLGDREGAGRWGRSLDIELQALDSAVPPGPVPADVAGRLQQLRGTLELRGAAGEGVGVLGRHVLLAGLNDVEPIGSRVVWVVPCEDDRAVEAALSRLGPVLQSVGMDGTVLRDRFAHAAAAAGATRIVSVRKLAFPPPEWIHDGRGPLRELVRWAERE